MCVVRKSQKGVNSIYNCVTNMSTLLNLKNNKNNNSNQITGYSNVAEQGFLK